MHDKPNVADLMSTISLVSKLLEQGIEGLSKDTTLQLYRDMNDAKTKVLAAQLGTQPANTRSKDMY